MAIREDSDFNKALAAGDKKQNTKNLSAALIAAFGNGKESKEDA